MQKTDLTKTFKSYYTAKTKPHVIDVDPAVYLSISGQGDPAGESFASDVEALYAVAYTIKFILKALEKDFVVAKLEGQWWFDEEKYDNLAMAEVPQKIPRSEWQYRLLLRMPDFVTEGVIKEAIKKVMLKKPLPKAGSVEFFKMKAGKAVQILHVGAFENEPETLMKLHEFMFDNNLHKHGYHHEIYLSDFRKTPADKLKTILREPVS